MTALRQMADNYLVIRRSLGYKLVDQGHSVAQFVDFLDANSAPVITTERALAWAQAPTTPSAVRQRQRLAAVRDFAHYMQSIDPNTEVPARTLLPAHFERPVPYLYAPTEITSLMSAARSLPSPLSAATYDTLIGLLAVTGMRLGEAIGLDRHDVNLPSKLIVVRGGKNGKSRQVPLHLTTVESLDAFGRRRDKFCSRPKGSSFFVSPRAGRLSESTVQRTFNDLRQQTGLNRKTRRRPPRLHDLRHTFVLSTLLNWYRAGVDIQAQLPVLSTYLGHVDPKSTYWYFQAAPELLALAADRLEHAWVNSS